ncbi:PREDICTED: uncharacterized protein LOC104746517 [Camelina sativa]|uniref:Uncharacterized protein LOC104746517 n=1 Tax=Camelina sativa TaxID=90675 RepID=A0ABM1R0Y5_CAMSA|nr:PREDICTED: uncharacterized protein LOC104746517 [Camelina sativa]
MKGDLSAARKPTQEKIIDEAWLEMVETILIKEEGLEYVLKHGVPPDPSKNPELEATITREEVSQWRERVREDMRALQFLQFALPESLFRKTIWAPSAKILWDYLYEVAVHRVAESVGDFTFGEDTWRISSSNSNHMTPYAKFFTTYESRLSRVEFTSGGCTLSKGVGDVTFMTKDGEKTIKNVLYVPEIKGNALSVSQMARNGFKVEMDGERCTIWDRTTGKVFGDTTREERGFCLRLVASSAKDHVAEHFVDRTKQAKVKFTSGDGTTTTYVAEGIGNVTFLTKEGAQTIENVLYIPGIKGNALSVSQLKNSGFGVAFDEEKTRCTIWNQTTYWEEFW